MASAIKIENLSKRYRLGVYGVKTLREDLQRWWWSVRGKGDPLLKVGQENRLDSRSGEDYVWALCDINLEVEQGEVLGIIGKNGAGKSTLLKILSRITSPTTGEVKIRGRLGSLLEVGTGFHPELTGRENIYLNGAILGMKRSEIDRKFDDIVDFAGVAKYIDTPVKRYSSGMYVRLGFAVAAFLEPDILVVDEVLAVGDAEFQKRAIGKMQEVSRGEGRTVLFVSHNMASIKQLCSRAILLDKGRIIDRGEVNKVIQNYITYTSISGSVINLEQINRPKKIAYFTKFEFLNFPIQFGQTLKFKIGIKKITDEQLRFIDIGIGIQNSMQLRIIHLSNLFIKKQFTQTKDYQEYLISVENNLAPDIYTITLFLSVNNLIVDWLRDIIKFEIHDGNPYGYTNTSQITGVIFPKFDIVQL